MVGIGLKSKGCKKSKIGNFGLQLHAAQKTAPDDSVYASLVQTKISTSVEELKLFGAGDDFFGGLCSRS